MFKNLFSRQRQDEDRWETTIKNGDMIRRCTRTGRMEYRDCLEKKWIPISDAQQLGKIRSQQWITLESYEVGNEA